MATDCVKGILYFVQIFIGVALKKQVKARSVPFSETRSRHASETAEDYVEAVMDLIEELSLIHI